MENFVESKPWREKRKENIENVENIRLESTFGGKRFNGKFRGIKLDDVELKREERKETLKIWWKGMDTRKIKFVPGDARIEL